MVLFCYSDVATEIVNSVFWEDALRNETIDIATGSRTTPMRKLIKKMPGTFTYYFVIASFNPVVPSKRDQKPVDRINK